ncbi:extracellular solute-binding protein [Streptomyces sp. SCUT-3]|uniref:extracellular solute-binding protein n=1 Tax=Streptomyces sp. SCUT-3 TaxID=2684469 RepID=UPI000CAEE838|nr:extracellular solute-binding protein [Streptomyces sp. SCUT-3]PLW73142.1 sugar ABC transporter substrate-binding protein [Streptomyces sp. DJ]QMV21813.1 extracellular solute-binding protein [Streptomyces sp. SCUT-3]
MKRGLMAAVCVAAMTAGIAGCGADGGGEEAAAREITVWLTVDAQKNWPELVKQADQAFAARHKGVKVKHEYFEWTAKNQKLDAVLATDKVPDVVEMGNSETLGYLAKGAFAEIDPSRFENSEQWLDALRESVTWNGKLYGVPYYAGARTATWRTDIAEEVGVDEPPADWKELTAALDKIQKKKGDKFSAWYQPTRDWYTGMAFVKDAGGDIAELEGGKWTATLSTPESVKGLKNWKAVIDAYMHGDKNKDDADRYIVYGQGRSAMIYANSWEGATAADPKFDKTGGKLAENLESFALPGTKGGLMPNFIGGSDLVIPAKSDAKEMAADWIKGFTDTKAQRGLIEKGNLPNAKSLLAPLADDPETAAAARANENTWFVPMAPGWLQVEKKQVLQNMLNDIAVGKKSVEAAAKDADAQINAVINGG